MKRIVEDPLFGSEFDNLSQIHHGDMMADVSHDAQIVGNKQQRDVALGLNRAKKIDNLRLDRNIQGRHRFVGDDHPRLHRQGSRNPDSLPLPPAEFVRKALPVIGIQPDGLENRSDFIPFRPTSR